MEHSRLSALRVFAYLNAEKAAEYRCMMRVFVEAKSRFALHLRPPDIQHALAATDPVWEVERIEANLQQLVEWGNLEARPDTTEVTTVEEFYRPRYLYQLTTAGLAAERAISVFEAAITQPGELQATALYDIREYLGQLLMLAQADALDAGKVRQTLVNLCHCFESLTSQAQIFMGGLQRTIDLQGIDLDAFLAYKEQLIEYLERFIGELIFATAAISKLMQDIDQHGIDRLLEAATGQQMLDAVEPTEPHRQQAVQSWQARWQGLKSWFIASGDMPSNADILRAQARSAIPSLLMAVSVIHDRRVTRSDRTTDLRTLARWFAQTDSDAEAHRLWRAAFGLAPSRHLRIDDETLQARDQNPVPAQRSWLDAEPIRITPRLRKTGRSIRPGRAKAVIDRSQAKALLAALAQEETEQIIRAQRRLATGQDLRLSDLGQLDPAEFQLFLDLLGAALSHKLYPHEVVETTSSDGVFSIRLAPLDSPATALIHTTSGLFKGPDHVLRVCNLLAAHPTTDTEVGR